MGSSVDLQLQLTDQLKLKMKFIIFASLFALSVAEAQWSNNYGFNRNFQPGMSYMPYMNNFYNRHMYKREADSEAEPEADAWMPGFYGNNWHYGQYMNNFYNRHMYKREADSNAEPKADAWMPGFYGNNWQYGPYMNNFYSRHMYKREAEADPQFYYNNYYGNNYRYPYNSWYGRYPYTWNYNRFNRFYHY